MTPSPTPSHRPEPLLALGAHPDDIEFGCGGIIALESRLGHPAHFVICSKGEAASNGTPDLRQREAERGAALLGATLSFVDLGGDARFEETVGNAMALAAEIRRHRPAIVLAPTPIANQHPDHACLGRLAQRAARLARYGGVAELREWPPHAIGQLLCYAVTPDAEPKDIPPVFVDVSDEPIMAAWQAAMEAHASQSPTRDYVNFQLTRAWLNGQRCGVAHAMPLFPNDPLLLPSLAHLGRSARNF